MARKVILSMLLVDLVSSVEYWIQSVVQSFNSTNTCFDESLYYVVIWQTFNVRSGVLQSETVCCC